MRMRPVAVFIALALLQVAGWAQVTITVNYNGGSAAPFMADQSGTALPDSTANNVEIGYFDNVGGFAISPGNANDLQLIGPHWHLFDSTNIRTIFGNAGAFAATHSGTDSSFFGKPIDLWVFKTSDGLAPDHTDFHNVLQYGLFSSTRNDTQANTWIFPSSGPPANSTTLTSSDVNATQGIIYFGSLGAGGASLNLAPVPEPSALALLSIGLAFTGFVARRFRNSN